MPGKRKQRFFYCPKCAGSLKYQEFDGVERLTCISCSNIFYENPIVGVAGILLDDNNEILLGKRKNGTYAGKWCIPCGYLEYHEDIRYGLCREFLEETGLEVEVTGIVEALSNFHDSQNHTVGIWFMVSVTGGSLHAGDDLEEVCFFGLYDVPPMAFPTDMEIIRILRRN
jgi:8-oxo-dGTP diphosphatase